MTAKLFTNYCKYDLHSKTSFGISLGHISIMNMKSLLLSSILFASLSANAQAQEFIVSPIQANNQPQSQQENCVNESGSCSAITSGSSSSSSSQSSQNQSPGPSSSSTSSSGSVQIDRSGMDKASIHLQIFQQTAPHLSEPNQNKKQAPDDKKSASKTIGLGTSVTEEY